MKIIQTFSDSRNSSISMLTEERTAALASMGHTVGILAPKGSKMAERFGKPDTDTRMLTSRFSIGSGMTVPVKLQRLLGKKNDGTGDMTVIHCPDLRLADRALMACRAAGKGKVIYEPATGIPPADTPLSRYVFESVAAVVVPTQADADLLLGSGVRIDPEKVRVIHPGVRIGRSSGRDEKNNGHPTERRSKQDMTLIWCGEIVPGCGLETLVEALGTHHHQRIGLIVAGQGPGRYVMPIIRRSRALGIDSRIEWVGDAAPTPDLVSKADVGVITAAHSSASITSAAVYMTAGLPVVWADGVLARDTIMSDVDGIIAGHTADDLAEALLSLYDDPQWLFQLGHDAQAKAEAQFSLRGHIDAMTSLYLSLTC